jgi:ribosome-binding factor A
MSEQYYRRNQPSQRQLQVGAAIHRVVMQSLAMDEFLSSRFNSISFTGVRMTGGLKQATIMFITSDSNVKKIKTELNKINGYFRRLIASELNLRFTPEVDFEYDKATAQLDFLQQTLDKIREI